MPEMGGSPLLPKGQVFSEGQSEHQLLNVDLRKHYRENTRPTYLSPSGTVLAVV